MIKAEIVPGALDAVLDGPAQPGSGGQIGQCGVGARMGEMV